MNLSLNGFISSVKPSLPAGGYSGLREYFRYHGLLAPGVRLLRRMSFPAKAGIVSVCFAMPMLLLSVQYLISSSQVLAHTRSGLEGVQVATEIQRLSNAVQADRRNIFLAMMASAAPRDVSVKARIQEAYTEVQDSYNKVGQAFGLADAFHAVRQRHAASADAGGPSNSDHLRSRIEYLSALHVLQLGVVRGSGMQRGVEPAVFDTQTVALELLPTLETHMASLGGYGALVLGGRQEAELRGRVQADMAMMDTQLTQMSALFGRMAATDPALAERLGKAAQWKAVHDFMAEARTAFGSQAAKGVPEAILVSAEQAISASIELQRDAMASLRELLEQRASTVSAQRGALMGVVLLCLGLAVYTLMCFFRVMDGGLKQIQGQVQRMADGDLSSRAAPLGNDEVANALAGLAQSVARLAELFATVRLGVSAVSFASGEIAKGNQDLTRRTEQSAQSVQQVVNGVTRYIEQLDASGQRVDEAVHCVDAMRLDAARSRSHMQKLQERMRALQGKSREIGEIVELIDGIAFRTNILALNASVEAAKAGEAGRGFAVVAQEVRSLAMRSAESARQINDIIARSTDDIEQGSALAEQAGITLRETDDHVARIHAAMNNIVTLTRSGQANSQDILREIRDLGKLAGENTQLVEQMAAAAVALSQHGDSLDRKVATFKLS